MNVFLIKENVYDKSDWESHGLGWENDSHRLGIEIHRLMCEIVPSWVEWNAPGDGWKLSVEIHHQWLKSSIYNSPGDGWKSPGDGWNSSGDSWNSSGDGWNSSGDD